MYLFGLMTLPLPNKLFTRKVARLIINLFLHVPINHDIIFICQRNWEDMDIDTLHMVYVNICKWWSLTSESFWEFKIDF